MTKTVRDAQDSQGWQSVICMRSRHYQLQVVLTHDSVNEAAERYPGNKGEHYNGSNNIVFQKFPKFTWITQSIEEILKTRDKILSCLLALLLNYKEVGITVNILINHLIEGYTNIRKPNIAEPCNRWLSELLLIY